MVKSTFEIDEFQCHCLMECQTNIGLMLQHADKISVWKRRFQAPKIKKSCNRKSVSNWKGWLSANLFYLVQLFSLKCLQPICYLTKEPWKKIVCHVWGLSSQLSGECHETITRYYQPTFFNLSFTAPKSELWPYWNQYEANSEQVFIAFGSNSSIATSFKQGQNTLVRYSPSSDRYR